MSACPDFKVEGTIDSEIKMTLTISTIFKIGPNEDCQLVHYPTSPRYILGVNIADLGMSLLNKIVLYTIGILRKR